MADIEIVDRLAQGLQGKYGHASQTWLRSSEPLREQWRIDARELLEEFPGIAPLQLTGLLRLLAFEQAQGRMAFRHAAQADAEEAKMSARLAMFEAEREQARAHDLTRFLQQVDAELAGDVSVAVPGETLTPEQIRLLPGGSVIMGHDGWVAQRDITGIDWWAMGGESWTMESLFEESETWVLVLVGRGEPASDRQFG